MEMAVVVERSTWLLDGYLENYTKQSEPGRFQVKPSMITAQ